MMKRFLVALVILVVGLGSMYAQGQQEPENQVITLKLGTNLPAQHVITLGYQAIADDVKAKSNGRLVINVFPSEQLGKEREVVDGIAANVGDMSAIGPGEMARRFKPAMSFDAPYVFQSPEHLLKFANGPVGKKLWDDQAAKTNIRNLGMLYYGTRHITTSKVAAMTPADMEGLKLRVPDQPMALAYGKGLGAKPTPMAFGEVYLALQQGVVDGQENPIPTIVSAKFNEVQKNLILSGHVVASVGIIISEKRYQSLPADLQKILSDSVISGVEKISQQIVAAEKAQIEELKKSGMNIVEPDREAFMKGTSFIIKEYENEWGKGLYEEIQSVK